MDMELHLESAPVRQQAYEAGYAAPHDCESFATMPLSTLLYYVLTESSFLGPVPGVRGGKLAG